MMFWTCNMLYYSLLRPNRVQMVTEEPGYGGTSYISTSGKVSAFGANGFCSEFDHWEMRIPGGSGMSTFLIRLLPSYTFARSHTL